MNINVTKEAKDMIKKTLEDKNVTNPVVRIYMAGFGWGGPNFGIALDEQKDNDFNIEDEGINYVVEDELIKKYGGFEVDYSTGWLYKGFKVRASYGGSSC